MKEILHFWFLKMHISSQNNHLLLNYDVTHCLLEKNGTRKTGFGVFRGLKLGDDPIKVIWIRQVFTEGPVFYTARFGAG